MTWVVVPNLLEGRDQLDRRFPNRDKGAEGTIGDTSHKASASSHNPDETGNPEYSDHDKVDEVRAADFDKDLRDVHGVTMEQLVQHWITLLRAGEMWWIRYLIYAGRIWHRRDNFVTRVYTGSNKHYDHVHVNSDFTQQADMVRGTDWHVEDFGLDGVPTTPVSQTKLDVDGMLGEQTIRRWQQVMGTPVDGVITPGNSDLVRAVQQRLKATVDRNLVVDGDGIYQNGHRYKTVGALQRYLKSPVDEVMSTPRSEVVKALQRRLNEGRF